MPYARKEITQWRQGHYYHMFNRGARGLTIFPDAASYMKVIGKMKTYQERYEITVVAYCLLPNHYHFLVRQDSHVEAGQLPQRIFNGYSKWYNKRNDKSGTLFEHRFESRQVGTDEYLRYLCKYIHANPVKHGIAGQGDAWPFSNYPEWIGVRKGTLFDREVMTAYFGGSARYRQLVDAFVRDKGYLSGGFDVLGNDG